MTKENDILRIVKEDILESLGKKNERISLKSMELEVIVSHFFISKAIRELERENLIKFSFKKESGEKYIQLTKEGQVKAGDIVKKHLILEEYFKKRMTEKEAIKATNILEHYISTEVIDNIKKISTFKKEGISLVEFKQNKGLITDIGFGIGLFERLISMGIHPGEKIKITSRIPNAIIVEIKNKKFALDKDIAKEIKVSENEKY